MRVAQLLTYDADNPGSATVIERCGGILEGIRPNPPEKPKQLCRIG